MRNKFTKILKNPRTETKIRKKEANLFSETSRRKMKEILE